MTVNDDPLVWFYYIYGHTTLPPMAALWVYLRLNDRPPGTRTSGTLGQMAPAMS